MCVLWSCDGTVCDGGVGLQGVAGGALLLRVRALLHRPQGRHEAGHLHTMQPEVPSRWAHPTIHPSNQTPSINQTNISRYTSQNLMPYAIILPLRALMWPRFQLHVLFMGRGNNGTISGTPIYKILTYVNWALYPYSLGPFTLIPETCFPSRIVLHAALVPVLFTFIPNVHYFIFYFCYSKWIPNIIRLFL